MARRTLFVIAERSDAVRIDLEHAAREMLEFNPTVLLPADYARNGSIRVCSRVEDALCASGREHQAFWEHSHVRHDDAMWMEEFFLSRRFFRVANAREAVLWLSGS